MSPSCLNVATDKPDWGRAVSVRTIIGDNGKTMDATAAPTTAPTTQTTAPAAKIDAVLARAIELARSAALDVGGAHVGRHLAVHADGDRLVTHAFASLMPGYSGWIWAVTLARPPRAKAATVDEVVMLPGSEALLAPAWVPWDERLQPGDLGPGDLIPRDADDPRLVPAYLASDDPAVEAVAFELGLGRKRVLSRDGRLDAADRWYEGDTGPDNPMARQAQEHCGTCGFMLMLGGSLSAAFGVCGNEITATDGRVVSVEYGCGAHSETHVVLPPLAESGELVYDDGDDITLV